MCIENVDIITLEKQWCWAVLRSSGKNWHNCNGMVATVPSGVVATVNY